MKRRACWMFVTSQFQITSKQIYSGLTPVRVEAVEHECEELRVTERLTRQTDGEASAPPCEDSRRSLHNPTTGLRPQTIALRGSQEIALRDTVRVDLSCRRRSNSRRFTRLASASAPP